MKDVILQSKREALQGPRGDKNKLCHGFSLAISSSLPSSTLALCDGQATPDPRISSCQKDPWEDILSFPLSHTEG